MGKLSQQVMPPTQDLGETVSSIFFIFSIFLSNSKQIEKNNTTANETYKHWRGGLIFMILSYSLFSSFLEKKCYVYKLQELQAVDNPSFITHVLIFSSPGQSPGLAIILPLALALVSALAKC